MTEYLIRIEGQVQGVGYRDFAQRAAAGLGLAGYAVNLPGGGVEVLAQGDKSALEILVERLREGPRLAAVDDVQVRERVPAAQLTSFEVR